MLLILCFAIFSPIFAFTDSSNDDLWMAYKAKYKTGYEKYEDMKRSVWEENVRMIAKHNLEADLGLHTYRLGLNKFSDMTKCELDVYRKCLSGRNNSSQIKSHNFFQCDQNCLASLPQSVDWRKKNFVTPVKDQGECGSCWAFSSTGALEGQNKAKTGMLISLSEQNLVDCSHKQGNAGCDGGRMDFAFQYVIQNHGIDTEKIYPYKARRERCKFIRSGVGANCTNYVTIPIGSEKHLQAAVANIGPVSVAIDASSYKFMQYKEGIYYDKSCSPEDMNHAVLVVGYGSFNGSEYWIVKNSWGESWGMDGYILMARNADNMCGIASMAMYPII